MTYLTNFPKICHFPTQVILLWGFFLRLQQQNHKKEGERVELPFISMETATRPKGWHHASHFAAETSHKIICNIRLAIRPFFFCPVQRQSVSSGDIYLMPQYIFFLTLLSPALQTRGGGVSKSRRRLFDYAVWPLA